MTQLDKLKTEVFLSSFEGNSFDLDNINKLPNLNTNWTKVAENLNTTFDLQDILKEIFQQYLIDKDVYVDYVDVANKEVTILDIITFDDLQYCKDKVDKIGWIMTDYDYIVEELEYDEKEREKELQEKETKREEYLKILRTAPIENLEIFVKNVNKKDIVLL